MTNDLIRNLINSEFKSLCYAVNDSFTVSDSSVMYCAGRLNSVVYAAYLIDAITQEEWDWLVLAEAAVESDNNAMR